MQDSRMDQEAMADFVACIVLSTNCGVAVDVGALTRATVDVQALKKVSIRTETAAGVDLTIKEHA